MKYMTNGSEWIRARRLQAQFLAGDAPESAEQTVARLVGIQAQSTVSAYWSIGLRSAGSSINDVQTAVRTNKIVKSWLFRGTLHYATAADFRWLIKLLAPLSGRESLRVI
mgnify:CR=1 FL=1